MKPNYLLPDMILIRYFTVLVFHYILSFYVARYFNLQITTVVSFCISLMKNLIFKTLHLVEHIMDCSSFINVKVIMTILFWLTFKTCLFLKLLCNFVCSFALSQTPIQICCSFRRLFVGVCCVAENSWKFYPILLISCLYLDAPDLQDLSIPDTPLE